MFPKLENLKFVKHPLFEVPQQTVEIIRKFIILGAYDFGLQLDYKGNLYSQKQPQANFAELWERMPVEKPATKFDGAWKRVYEI